MDSLVITSVFSVKELVAERQWAEMGLRGEVKVWHS